MNVPQTSGTRRWESIFRTIAHFATTCRRLGETHCSLFGCCCCCCWCQVHDWWHRLWTRRCKECARDDALNTWSRLSETRESIRGRRPRFLGQDFAPRPRRRCRCCHRRTRTSPGQHSAATILEFGRLSRVDRRERSSWTSCLAQVRIEFYCCAMRVLVMSIHYLMCQFLNMCTSHRWH